MPSAHTTIRRAALTAVALGALTAGLLTFGAAQGFAYEGNGESYHPEPQAMFGTPGSGEGQLSNPAGVAVNEETGDVYVADKGNNRVEEFDAEGKYLAQFNGSEAPTGQFSKPTGVAVDNSTSPAKGDVYVVDPGHRVVDVFDSTGKYLTQITGPSTPFAGEPTGVAVDGSGDVWIPLAEGVNTVYELSPGGAGLVSQFATEYTPRDGIAVDAGGGSSSGFVYLLEEAGEHLTVYTTEGAIVTRLVTAAAESLGLAVNVANHHLFVEPNKAHQGTTEYGAFGKPYGSPIGGFGKNFYRLSGIAVNGRSGTFYGSEEGDQVAIFPTFPAALTGEVAAIAGSTASLSGIVNPNGKPATYHFQYGETTAYGSSTPPSPAGESEIALPQTAEATGLVLGRTYHYRIVA